MFTKREVVEYRIPLEDVSEFLQLTLNADTEEVYVQKGFADGYEPEDLFTLTKEQALDLLSVLFDMKEGMEL